METLITLMNLCQGILSITVLNDCLVSNFCAYEKFFMIMTTLVQHEKITQETLMMVMH